MIGFVFSKQSQPEDETPVHWNKQYKDTKPRESWWLGLSPVGFTTRAWREWRERLQYQRKVIEPTAKKDTPAWATKKNKDVFTRGDGSCAFEAERATASPDVDASDD